MSIFSCCVSGYFRFWRSPVTSAIFKPHLIDQITMTDDGDSNYAERDNMSLLTKQFTSLSLEKQTPVTLKKRVIATKNEDKGTLSTQKSTKELVTELATVTESLKALSIANHHHPLLLIKSL